MSTGNYYKILEVKKTATNSEIKTSYRKLAVKFHPDKNQGDSKAAEKFKEITESYETLRNAEKRKKYDNQTGKSSFFK